MATRYIRKITSLSQLEGLLNHQNAAGFVYNASDDKVYVNGDGALRPLMSDRTRGTTYFVDANLGVDTNTGKGWAEPFLTMSKAFTSVASGDTIVFTGKVREQLITPVNIFDVSVIGIGNRPHHADSTPTGGQFATATWTTPASGATTAALVKVLQQGWRFENILFAGPTDHACIWLFRNAGAGDLERDASHAVIRNCRFAGGQDGIWITEVFDILIEDNIFGSGSAGFTGFDILGKAGDGVANPLLGIIQRNIFYGSANHVKNTCSYYTITGNFFDDGSNPNTTVVLNTTGDGVGAANNIIVHNYFQTATANFNTPDVVGNATDVWSENVTPDASAAGTAGIYEIGRPA
jgi:hypothetical protein